MNHFGRISCEMLVLHGFATVTLAALLFLSRPCKCRRHDTFSLLKTDNGAEFCQRIDNKGTSMHVQGFVTGGVAKTGENKEKDRLTIRNICFLSSSLCFLCFLCFL